MGSGDFYVVPARAAGQILAESRREILKLVKQTYLAHEQGGTVNPHSTFLRFPRRPGVRVMALPAFVGGVHNTVGLKWISSVPSNVSFGLPRASAVLVLNDYDTGRPIACLEAAGISAARTGASAALAATVLSHLGARCRVGFIGTGVISTAVLDFLLAAGAVLGTAVCFDLRACRAEEFASRYHAVAAQDALATADIGEALDCDLVVLATTATRPHVDGGFRLRAGQLFLHVSLRDLAPEVVLTANNVVDDVDHCLTADTSPHLAEQLCGSRDFINGTLAAALAGTVRLDPSRGTIFSPFGLGVLDVCVGAYVLEMARERATAIRIPEFFTDGLDAR